MTKEERAAERKAYRENIAEVNEWKRQVQAELEHLTPEETRVFFDNFVEELRTQHGLNLVFPEQPQTNQRR